MVRVCGRTQSPPRLLTNTHSCSPPHQHQPAARGGGTEALRLGRRQHHTHRAPRRQQRLTARRQVWEGQADVGVTGGGARIAALCARVKEHKANYRNREDCTVCTCGEEGGTRLEACVCVCACVCE